MSTVRDEIHGNTKAETYANYRERVEGTDKVWTWVPNPSDKAECMRQMEPADSGGYVLHFRAYS